MCIACIFVYVDVQAKECKDTDKDAVQVYMYDMYDMWIWLDG